MILTDLSELEWGYFQEIIAIAGEQEDGIASEIGVSLRYLNTKLKGAKEIFPGRSRTALLRTRQKLERRELIRDLSHGQMADGEQGQGNPRESHGQRMDDVDDLGKATKQGFVTVR